MAVKEDAVRAGAGVAPPGDERGDGRAVRLAQALALRTGHGVFRPIWRASFALATRTLAAVLLRGVRNGAAYVRGSFAVGEPVFGLSDVDLILVLPDGPGAPGTARQRVWERWRRVARRAPVLGRLFTVNVYEQSRLAEVAGATVLTHGLDARPAPLLPPALLVSGRHAHLHLRPGLYGATADWRRVAGPERRPPRRAPEGPDRWPAAWLDLQCWWRYAFQAATTDDRLRAADLCVKLVAEGARIWLWIAHGERCSGRTEALGRALSRLPEEEEALRLALTLHRTLPARPEPPIADALACFTRVSTRLAERCATELDPLGGTSVRLVSTGADSCGREDELPLVDWRALAYPTRPDETLALRRGSPAGPTELAAAARAETDDGPRPGLLAPSLLVLPTLDLACRPLVRGAVRSVQCEATDPVSLALVAGRREARFPGVRGFAAWDVARRAAAERAAWLALGRERDGPSDRHDLGLLLCAARAVVFLAGLRDGDPELPLTVPAIAACLAERTPAARLAVEQVAGAYAAGTDPGRAPDALVRVLQRELGSVGTGSTG